MIAAIRQAGGDPRETIYPDLNHDVWTVTYANDDLYTWLFAQNRASQPPITPPSAATLSGQTKLPGQSASWTVSAGGTPPPLYQWQRLAAGSTGWEDLREGGSYQGTTTATLTVSPTTIAMSGDQFRCVLTNAGGTVTSSAATLTVTGTGSSLLLYPDGIAGDVSGNLYVADASSNTILKITSTGVLSTLAGAAGRAGSGDDTGGGALFNQPGGVAVDASGNVFVADTGNAVIRKISPNGAVTTVAGSAGSRGSRDGYGAGALFNQPGAVAVDAPGNLYVTDSFNATLRKIAPDGAVTTLAGAAGIRGDADGAGTAARFNQPGGVAVDASGNVYLADTYNDTIRKISPAGVVTTIAGSAGLSGATDLKGANALFNQPSGIAVDAAGNVYVADTGNATIRRIIPDGTAATLAGLAGISGLCDTINGPALFNQPHALAVDGAGVLFVADTANGVIRKIAPGEVVSTLTLTAASNNSTPSSGDASTTSSSSGGGAGASGSGRGGGAPSWWFFGAIILLATARSVAGIGHIPLQEDSRK
jgi:sugar lactone lactonase YvrE